MSDKTVTVTNDADFRTALAAGYTTDQIKIGAPDNSAALKAAREEGIAAGKAEAKAAHDAEMKAARETVATAERARLTALREIAEPGFDAELKAAIEGGHSPEQFALTQMKAAKERGVTLGAIRKDSPHAPNAPAPAPGSKGASAWDNVVGRHVAAIGAAASRTGAKLKGGKVAAA